ncbi:hypothetical protein LguiB_009269 [Lonicera macranthoides]
MHHAVVTTLFLSLERKGNGFSELPRGITRIPLINPMDNPASIVWFGKYQFKLTVMDGERNHMKRKEPAEGFDLNLRSGNINTTEQAESSNSRANNEAGRTSTPSQQNQVHPELGFAMLAGENRNPWRNIRQRINGPPFGSDVMNSQRSIGPPVMNPWRSIGSTSQRYLAPQQIGGHHSFVSMMHSVLHRPFRGAQMACLDLRFISTDEFYAQPEWEEEPDMHSDLRLDIDNMSYEVTTLNSGVTLYFLSMLDDWITNINFWVQELLALGEQIGTVSTGLAEDAIDGQMRRYIYPHPNRSGPQMEEAQCCICLEGFHRGDLVGRLDCNHEFHYDCIKEWLLEKNTCPICKSTGLSG